MIKNFGIWLPFFCILYYEEMAFLHCKKNKNPKNKENPPLFSFFRYIFYVFTISYKSKTPQNIPQNIIQRRQFLSQYFEKTPIHQKSILSYLKRNMNHFKPRTLANFTQRRLAPAGLSTNSLSAPSLLL